MAVQAPDAPRILIVRRDNIGDLVCTTPLIDALRARFPQGWIGALVNTYNAEVLARNPALDAVVAYEKLKHRGGGSLAGNLWQRIRAFLELRGMELDTVLLPSATPRALRMVRGLRPRKLIADAGAPDGRHEVERAFALGASLGVAGGPGKMRVFPDAGKCDLLKKQLGDGPFVAVHISARRPAQRWPLERYIELIFELKKDSRVILLWAPGAADDPRHPGDDETAREIALKTESFPVPTPDLATLIATLSLADRVICPDGGAMHLAAALGKPVVALFGDSPPERWRPWAVPHRVVRPESRNLADLETGVVLAAYAALRAGT